MKQRVQATALFEFKEVSCIIYLSFNKKVVGYFLVNKTEEFNNNEEELYDLFISYLALILFNTKYTSNDIIDNLYVEILNTTNLNLIITDIEFNIYYYNENFRSFILTLNPYTQKIIDNLKKYSYFNLIERKVGLDF